MTFAQIIRARLLALILADGRGLRQLATDAGRSPVHYERKLGERPTIGLSMEDVDEVLRILGLPVSAMLAPTDDVPVSNQ